MGEYNFYLMRIEDYDEIYALWKTTHGISLSEADNKESVQRYLERNPGQCLVCRFSGAIVGTILCGNDGRRAYIHHAAVAAGHRRHGVAAELVKLALNKQKELGMARCHLLVRYNNELGKAFWDSTGFFPRDDIMVMSKDL